jgi:hypothetical protein
VVRLAVPLALAAGLLVAGRAAVAEPAPAPAVAPADSAAVAMSKARAAGERAQRGDYAGAVRLFKEANALDARPEYACNVGIAYYKARDLPRAYVFLEDCLAAAGELPADFQTAVRRVFATVEERLEAGDFAPVELRVSPPHARIVVSSFASDEPIASGRRVWLRVGQHLVLATALGHETRQIAVDLFNRDPRRVDMVLEPLLGDRNRVAAPAPAPAPVPTPPPVATTAPAATMAPAPTPPAPVVLTPVIHTPDSRRRSPTYVFAVGATVATVVGFTLSTLLMVASSDSEPDDPYDPYDSDPAAEGLRVMAVTGYIGTAITGVASVVLWSQVSRQNKAMVGASAGDGSASLWLGGRF